MIPFQFERPDTLARASELLRQDGSVALAGGTTVVDLMKLNVMTPSRVVSVAPIVPTGVEIGPDRIDVAAGTTMAALADADGLAEALPAVRQSLLLAATPQIRNMATIGGNLLQRTRSPYFRHTDMPVAGPSGEAPAEFGRDVDTSLLALFGHGGQLVGTYPGDFGVVFAAFRGEVSASDGARSRGIAAAELYRPPREGEHQYTNTLEAGEVIVGLSLKRSPMAARSVYYKVRERSSYAFALASAAVGLDLDGDTIREAAVGLGGVGAIPWVSQPAEDTLRGEPATDETFERAAEAAVAEAEPPAGAEFKVPLLRRTIVRALQTVRDRFPLSDETMWAMQHGRG